MTKKVDDFPVLVVADGRASKMEIGPRTEDPGYPTTIQFVYWDVRAKGPGGGPDSALCAIRMTNEWYDNFIKGKTIHKWLDTYDKFLVYCEDSSYYKFGCDVCGDCFNSLEEYFVHLDGHKTQLNKLL